MILLTNLFARKNVDNTIIFVQHLFTIPFQVCAITDKFVPLQSESLLYKRAKLTGSQYEHRYIFTLDVIHRLYLHWMIVQFLYSNHLNTGKVRYSNGT